MRRPVADRTVSSSLARATTLHGGSAAGALPAHMPGARARPAPRLLLRSSRSLSADALCPPAAATRADTAMLAVSSAAAALAGTAPLGSKTTPSRTRRHSVAVPLSVSPENPETRARPVFISGLEADSWRRRLRRRSVRVPE